MRRLRGHTKSRQADAVTAFLFPPLAEGEGEAEAHLYLKFSKLLFAAKNSAFRARAKSPRVLACQVTQVGEAQGMDMLAMGAPPPATACGRAGGRPNQRGGARGLLTPPRTPDGFSSTKRGPARSGPGPQTPTGALVSSVHRKWFELPSGAGAPGPIHTRWLQSGSKFNKLHRFSVTGAKLRARRCGMGWFGPQEPGVSAGLRGYQLACGPVLPGTVAPVTSLPSARTCACTVPYETRSSLAMA